MSENLNRGACDFSQYDTMTNEALEELLRLDSEAPEGQESDTERLLYIMALLAQRDRQQPAPGKTALKAWESFQQDYLPIEDEEPSESRPTTKPTRFRLCHAIAVAAAIALLIAIPVAAHAIGWEEIWNAVAKWSKETFSFVSSEEAAHTNPSPRNIDQYASLQEALDETDQDFHFIPTRIPDGYQLDSITIDERPDQKIYVAAYSNGKTLMKICVQSYIGSDPEKVEVNEDLLEIYIVSGTEYYIFSNFDQLRAVWIKDSCECYISGELTIEEIKAMIDSIGKE